MKRLAIALLLLAALAAAGCSRVKFTPQNEVHMGPSTFVNTTATVAAGGVIKFIDDSTGATHILVVGSNGVYQPATGAPTQLVKTAAYGGLMINQGQEIDVTFPTAGTYTITCTIHASMLATITVTP